MCDIHRTDAATYTERITNDRGGVKLSKLVLIVTAADSAGSFTLSAASAAVAPDVMVTWWHIVMGREYEIDSIGWARTWVSPDIWVDNNGDGVADSEVFFNTNNQLHIRLHNKGNAAASGIGVQFWYQDASPGVSDSAWLPVQNTGGVTQVLSGLSLAAASNDLIVDWSPVPSGASHHFCFRAVATVPGDPNTDTQARPVELRQRRRALRAAPGSRHHLAQHPRRHRADLAPGHPSAAARHSHRAA